MSALRHRGRGPWTTYLVGCLTFSLGATFFIRSGLGTDPLDTFSLGLIAHLPLTIGLAQGLVAALCIAVWSVWNRHRPVVMPFVTFFFCGSLIDALRAVDAGGLVPLDAAGVMLLGAVLCALGSALIIMAGVGIRAMDLVAITMMARWRIPFWVAKGTLETLLLVTGWLLGGPVGIGTLVFLCFVGLMIQPVMIGYERVLRIPNLGLAQATDPV